MRTAESTIGTAIHSLLNPAARADICVPLLLDAIVARGQRSLTARPGVATRGLWLDPKEFLPERSSGLPQSLKAEVVLVFLTDDGGGYLVVARVFDSRSTHIDGLYRPL